MFSCALFSYAQCLPQRSLNSLYDYVFPFWLSFSIFKLSNCCLFLFKMSCHFFMAFLVTSDRLNVFYSIDSVFIEFKFAFLS